MREREPGTVATQTLAGITIVVADHDACVQPTAANAATNGAMRRLVIRGDATGRNLAVGTRRQGRALADCEDR